MSGSGKGGNNRRNRQRFSNRKDDSQKYGKKHNDGIYSEQKFEKIRVTLHERPRWTAPILPNNPITTPNCPWCGKQIKDITTAISDKDTGHPVHFDCVLVRITEMEKLDANDSVCYIGGGRFGIIHYNSLSDRRNYSIRKILEWENKENNYEWRRPISEYFSIT